MMERLTTNTPQGNYQNALNLFYIKDSDTWVRGGGNAPGYPAMVVIYGEDGDA